MQQAGPQSRTDGSVRTLPAAAPMEPPPARIEWPDFCATFWSCFLRAVARIAAAAMVSVQVAITRAPLRCPQALPIDAVVVDAQALHAAQRLVIVQHGGGASVQPPKRRRCNRRGRAAARRRCCQAGCGRCRQGGAAADRCAKQAEDAAPRHSERRCPACGGAQRAG